MSVLASPRPGHIDALPLLIDRPTRGDLGGIAQPRTGDPGAGRACRSAAAWASLITAFERSPDWSR